jgi:hypothetical protein
VIVAPCLSLFSPLFAMRRSWVRIPSRPPDSVTYINQNPKSPWASNQALRLSHGVCVGNLPPVDSLCYDTKLSPLWPSVPRKLRARSTVCNFSSAQCRQIAQFLGQRTSVRSHVSERNRSMPFQDSGSIRADQRFEESPSLATQAFNKRADQERESVIEG